MYTLDIGCGRKKVEGAVGLDMNPAFKPDVLFEITRGKELPFSNKSFEMIYALDVIQQVDCIEWLLSEIHRVAMPNARVEIAYPHYSNPDIHNDPLNKSHLGIHFLEYFDPLKHSGYNNYYTLLGRHFPFRLEQLDFKFKEGKTRNLSHFLADWIGAEFYERHFSIFLPIQKVDAELIVIKPQ